MRPEGYTNTGRVTAPRTWLARGGTPQRRKAMIRDGNRSRTADVCRVRSMRLAMLLHGAAFAFAVTHCPANGAGSEGAPPPRGREAARGAAAGPNELRQQVRSAYDDLAKAEDQVRRLKREEARLEAQLKGELLRQLKKARKDVAEADEAVTSADKKVAELRDLRDAAREAKDSAQMRVHEAIAALGKQTSEGVRRRMLAGMGKAKREAVAKEAAYWAAKARLAEAELDGTWYRRELKAAREAALAVLAMSPELQDVLRREADAVAAEAAARMKTEELRRRFAEQWYSQRLGAALLARESALREAYNRSARKRVLARSTGVDLATQLGTVREGIEAHRPVRDRARTAVAEAERGLLPAPNPVERASELPEKVQSERGAGGKERNREVAAVERVVPREAGTTRWDRLRAAREERRRRKRLAKAKAEQEKRMAVRVHAQDRAVEERERELSEAQLAVEKLEGRIEVMERACREIDAQVERSERNAAAATDPEAKAAAAALVQHEKRVAAVLAADRAEARNELGKAKQHITAAREALGRSRKELEQAKSAAEAGLVERGERGSGTHQ